jgi:hypothetical protein
MKRLAIVGLMLCILASSVHAAQPSFNKAITEARRGLKERDAKVTLQALKDATAAAWRQLPFTALNVHLTAAAPAGYGRYVKRVDNVYRPGEPLIIYMEPVGFKVLRNKTRGVYRYKLNADFNLVDAWGRVVGGRRSFGQFGEEVHQFPDRFPLTFTISLAGLPPGDYKVETILRDMIAKKSYTVTTPIRIEGH